jgi:GTPase SAR1 family protein
VGRAISVALLGASGVGKTAIVSRILGGPAPRGPTRRPAFYRLPLGGAELYIVDTPGRRAARVAERYCEASRRLGARIEVIAYVYSVVEPDSLAALVEIGELLSCAEARERVLVGNKADLVESAGMAVEGNGAAGILGAGRVCYVSALGDSPEALLACLLGGAAP